MPLRFLFFEIVYMVDYIYGFPYVKPSLQARDEAYLIMANDDFDVFLDLVCKNFVEYICINVHKWDWSEVLFPCRVFVWFRNKGYGGLKKMS